MENYIIDLKVGGNATIDASTNFSTDAQQISRSYEWSLTFTKSGTDANPILSVEVSNDGVNWTNPYVESDCTTPITIELVDTQETVFDSILPYKYIRVSADANGTTTGTIAIKLNLIIDN